MPVVLAADLVNRRRKIVLMTKATVRCKTGSPSRTAIGLRETARSSKRCLRELSGLSLSW